MGWSNCCFNSLGSWHFSGECRFWFSCEGGSITCWGITLVLVINALTHLTIRFLHHGSRLKTLWPTLTLWSIHLIKITFTNTLPTSKRTQHISTSKLNQLMLIREIISVVLRIISTSINVFYGQNAEYLNVKTGYMQLLLCFKGLTETMEERLIYLA